MKKKVVSEKEFTAALDKVAKASGVKASVISNMKNRARSVSDLRMILAWHLRNQGYTQLAVSNAIGWGAAACTHAAVLRVATLEAVDEGFQAIMKKVSGIKAWKPIEKPPTSEEVQQRIAEITKPRLVRSANTAIKKERPSWKSTAAPASVWQKSRLCATTGGA
tara:strand:+ start:10936 stop:11427 length:492 start_codon:yes stop_codon:yes gene_type:complete